MNLKKKVICVLMMMITVVYAIALVNASTMSGEIPDICLPFNIDGDDVHKIWLFDYYDFNETESVTIDYDDPDGVGRYSLPPNHASINSQCFEISYSFEDRGNGWYEDVLRIQTYDDNCDTDLMVNLHDTPGIDQEFNIDIFAECNTTTLGQTPEYNLTGSFLDNLIMYYSFDGTTWDSEYEAFGYSEYPERYITGLNGKAIAGQVQGVDLTEPANTMDDGDFSISYWLKYDDSTDPNFIMCGVSNDELWNKEASGAELRVEVDATITDINNLFDNQWHHVVMARDGNDLHLYIDGVFNITFPGSAANLDWGICTVAYDDYNTNASFIDDLSIYDDKLEAAEVTQLYNGGSGFDFESYYAGPQSSSIADINMSGNTTYHIDYNDYFDNWTVVYVESEDPINNYTFSLGPGYATLNGDYYEISNNASGVTISSYFRPYIFNLTIKACGTGINPVCENQTLTVEIITDLSDVIQLNNFLISYDLGIDGSQMFSGNYFFQYYDKIVFAFPETNNSYPEYNHTGPLNGSWNYTIITEPVFNASYMVFLECNIFEDYEEYTYLGDLNVTVECGYGQSYFTVSAYNNYNQRVFFTAYNNHSNLGDYTQILSGNSNWPSGYIPSNVTSTTEGVERNIYEFKNLLPDDLSDENKVRFVWIILFVVSLTIFAGLYKVSVSLALYTTGIVGMILLFMFVSADFISPIYPILLTFLVVAYSFIKFIRGGI